MSVYCCNERRPFYAQTLQIRKSYTFVCYIFADINSTQLTNTLYLTEHIHILIELLN